MDLISIIVPVYKTESFLSECVSSIVKQTYPNLEIILVDDGSPDKCGSICDEWGKRDNRIKVLHIENGGAGRARNIGISVARGDYIAFVDSDDYLAPIMYERLLENFDEDIDIVECEYRTSSLISEQCDMSDKKGKRIYSTSEAMKEHIQDRYFKQIIWNKLYRRKVIEGISFPEGMLIDDEFWMYRVIGGANKLIRIDDCLYFYRQQTDSVMHMAFSLKRLQAIEAKKARLSYIETNFPSLYSEAHENLWFTCLYLGQMSLKYLSNYEARLALVEIMKTVKGFPLSISEISELSPRNRIWGLFSRISFKATCKVRNLFNIGF